MKISWIMFGVGAFCFGLGFLLLSFANPIANYLSKKPENTLTPEITKNAASNIEEEQNHTFVLYHDFTCPYCNKFYNDVYLPLSKKYSSKITFSFIPYFSNAEGKSFKIAKEFYCIENQKLDTSQYLENNIKDKDIEITEIYSKINIEEFNNCINNKETDENIFSIKNNANEKGVRGTPTFFINNIKFEKNQPIEKVELELLNIISK